MPFSLGLSACPCPGGWSLIRFLGLSARPAQYICMCFCPRLAWLARLARPALAQEVGVWSKPWGYNQQNSPILHILPDDTACRPARPVGRPLPMIFVCGLSFGMSACSACRHTPAQDISRCVLPRLVGLPFAQEMCTCFLPRPARLVGLPLAKRCVGASFSAIGLVCMICFKSPIQSQHCILTHIIGLNGTDLQTQLLEHTRSTKPTCRVCQVLS